MQGPRISCGEAFAGDKAAGVSASGSSDSLELPGALELNAGMRHFAFNVDMLVSILIL